MTGAKQHRGTEGPPKPEIGAAARVPAKAPRKPPSKAEIRAFLEANPDFIARNPAVLDALAPMRRHDGERVVDMQAFLIDRLRAENERLNRRHSELIATSRDNLSAQGRIHGAALALLEARTFHELIEAVTADLAVKLDVDVVTLAVETSDGLPAGLNERTVAGIRLLPVGAVDALLGAGNDCVLAARTKPAEVLYGAGTGLVTSEALLRLHASPEAPTGILALGSRFEGHFDPGQGTELLGFLARVLELCIRTWLGLPPS